MVFNIMFGIFAGLVLVAGPLYMAYAVQKTLKAEISKWFDDSIKAYQKECDQVILDFQNTLKAEFARMYLENGDLNKHPAPSINKENLN